MYKVIFLLSFGLFSITLNAYSDADFDGVDDGNDKCPNTPFSELVDINGCTIKSLKSPHNFDIIIGASYSESDYQTLNATDTFATTLQADYYYEAYSLQLSTSYFSTKGSGYSETGFNDTFVGISYQKEALENFSMRFGIGTILPSYQTSLNNNNIDYTTSLNISYSLQEFSIFGGYSYTFISDDDTQIIYEDNTTQSFEYQNTNAINLGVGYYANSDLYLSLSYNKADSIYTNIEDIETLSFYAYYNFDAHWFSTLSYSYGVSNSASKNYLSLRLGYFF